MKWPKGTVRCSRSGAQARQSFAASKPKRRAPVLLEHRDRHPPWVRPLGLLAAGDRTGALAALRAIPESPRDLLLEARACLVAEAALALGDVPLIERTHAELAPAAGQLAGAGSGLLTFGPVDHYLARLTAALSRCP